MIGLAVFQQTVKEKVMESSKLSFQQKSLTQQGYDYTPADLKELDLTGNLLANWEVRVIALKHQNQDHRHFQ